MSDWQTTDIPSQAGKLAVVTGANSGIGYYTALELARAGAEVILGCRDAAKGEQAARALQEASGGRVTLRPLDLASLASVRSFAADLLAEHPRLDLLINNAGVMALPRRELTVDGHERQFATNVLGHFALTSLLWPGLAAAPAARVVTLSSLMAWTARLDLTDLQSERSYRPMHVYSRTKLADLMFALELHHRAADGPVISVAAHPGGSTTNLQRHSFDWLIRRIGQSAAAGALPSLYAATAPGVRGGEYFGPRRCFGMYGPPERARVPRWARDERVAADLWVRCEQLTGAHFDVTAGARAA
jgi:NAD(P)-dependent dehydrogenase (short-subunit alcohol dehydrogenase family)